MIFPSLWSKRGHPRPADDSAGPGVPDAFSKDGLGRLTGIDTYATARPFPHLVIDDLFNPDALDLVLREWPSWEIPDLERYNDGTYVKLKYASNVRTDFGPYTRGFLHSLGEPLFLDALEKVTGIAGLVPDPYWHGGGLHFTRSGGKLAIHADFNKHFKFHLDRRINLIVYLNRGWTDANQGWLELWDRDMQSCVQRVLPVFNRTVIFSTTDFSYHGQPEPILGPRSCFAARSPSTTTRTAGLPRSSPAAVPWIRSGSAAPARATEPRHGRPSAGSSRSHRAISSAIAAASRRWPPALM